MVHEFMRIAKHKNKKFARQTLAETGWNLDTAIAVFSQFPKDWLPESGIITLQHANRNIGNTFYERKHVLYF